MCLTAGSLIVAGMLMGGMLNSRAIIFAIAVVMAASVVTWLCRRFANRWVAIALISIVVLALIGSAAWIEWQCATALAVVPTAEEGDNDGTIRVLMLAAGGLTMVVVAVLIGAGFGWLVPARRSKKVEMPA